MKGFGLTSDHVEVKILLDCSVYSRVERLSGKLGMDPGSWIELQVKSKLRSMGEGKGVL